MTSYVSRTRTDVIFTLVGAPRLAGITPMKATLTTFIETEQHKNRSFLEVTGPAGPGQHRSVKYNIYGTSARSIELAPSWLKEMIGYSGD